MANEQSIKLSMEGDLKGFIKDTKALSDALLDLASSAAEAVKNFLDLSTVGDAVTGKITAVSKAIKGLGSQSVDITPLIGIQRMPAIDGGIEKEIPKLQNAGKAQAALAKQLRDVNLSQALANDNDVLKSNLISKITGAKVVVKEQLDGLRKESQTSIAGLTASLDGPLSDLFSNLGNDIAKSLGKGGGLQVALKSVLTTFVTFMRALGTALIKAGTAVLAAKLLIKNPVTAIIVGTLTVAAAGLLQGLVNNAFPSFATGGLVTGPTLALVGDNPSGVEYMIPKEVMDKLGGNSGTGGGTLTARVAGTDLLFVLETASRENKRFG